MSTPMHIKHATILMLATGAAKSITCCLIEDSFPDSVHSFLESDWPGKPEEAVATYDGARKYLRDTLAKCIDMLDKAEAAR